MKKEYVNPEIQIITYEAETIMASAIATNGGTQSTFTSIKSSQLG